MTTYTGNIRKMATNLSAAGEVDYQLPIGNKLVAVNSLVGQQISLSHTGKINCIYCGCGIKKSYQQGYCFLATRRLARCDLCIVKPELCHFDQGTCREPDWGVSHCMQTHYIYLANASGVKVGITRAQNIPHRWMDQGAAQALPVLATTSRYIAGLMEVAIKEHISDKTNWRKMLQGPAEPLDLAAKWQQLAPEVATTLSELKQRFGDDAITAASPQQQVELTYPIVAYPEKVSALNFDKQTTVSGKLWGIKGQYWLVDGKVLNMRKFAGYELTLTAPHELAYQDIIQAEPSDHCLCQKAKQ